MRQTCEQATRNPKMSGKQKARSARKSKKKVFKGPSWAKLVQNVNMDVDNEEKNLNMDVDKEEDYVNMYIPPPSTVSQRKVKTIEPLTPRKLNNTITGYRIIDMEILANIISQYTLCQECFNPTLQLFDNASKRSGFSSSLSLKCTSCEFSNDFSTSRQIGKSTDINRRIVYTCRSLGLGHTGLERFASLMNMPGPMAIKTYEDIVAIVSGATKTVANETMIAAVDEIKASKINTETVDTADKTVAVVDTGISIDGAWTKRGYSSMNCVVTAISLDNGKVIDIEVMSRMCKACNIRDEMKERDPIAYANWLETHKCSYTYKGSAPGMEQHGTKEIFERSIDKYNVRYTELLGDGDTKSYTVVKNVYEGISVVKLECIGHYQKRTGSRLRKLKKKTKGLGGKGRLTDSMIDRLQNYFGMAIRQNCHNLEAMQSAAKASLFHVSSSKKNNWHYPHCPVGPDSWCGYNRDKANGTNHYRPGPGLPKDIVMQIRPIYVELTSEENLKKCLHGKTQNQNESFNSTMWDRIPKARYVALKHLEFGVMDAVANFNIGRKASILIFEKLGMIPGKFMNNGCIAMNRKRLRNSLVKNRKPVKVRRQILRARKMKKIDTDKEKEGKTYAPGGF